MRETLGSIIIERNKRMNEILSNAYFFSAEQNARSKLQTILIHKSK